MEIVCHQTGYKAILNFKPYSWSNKELHKVEGFIYDKKSVFRSLKKIKKKFFLEKIK